jgi:predicted membrane protein
MYFIMIVAGIILLVVRESRLRTAFISFCIMSALLMLCVVTMSWLNRDGMFMQDDISFGPEAFSRTWRTIGETLVFIVPVFIIGTLIYLIRKRKKSNQRVDPTVKTPVESGKVQGTAGHP